VGFIIGSLYLAFATVVSAIYLAFVAAPDVKSTLAVTRLTALADGIVGHHGGGPEFERLLPMSDLVDQRLCDTVATAHDSSLRLHVPEVTPLCSQGVDSTIAIVDIFSQAIAAFGCAAITLAPEG